MLTRIRSGLVLASVLLTLLAYLPTAQARQVTITRNDNSKITGELVSEDDQVVKIRRGENPIPIPIPRSDIKDIQYLQSIQEQYAEKRAALKDDDIEGRYELSRWLFENKAYDLAKKELTDLHARKPDHELVSILLKSVEARMKLVDQTPTPGSSGGTPGKTTTPESKPTTDTAVPNDPRLPTQKLSADEINIIRVYEIDPKARPRVTVPKDVIDALFAQYGSDPVVADIAKDARVMDRFRSAEGWQQLDVLFAARARPLYSKVIVRDDPAAIKTFRTRIMPTYINSSCATVQCHGGPQAKDIFFFRSNTNDDETVYTNFFILSKYEKAKNLTKMIDRTAPEKSLIIQMGMPRGIATSPHPDVKGWKATIANDKDPRYEMLLSWIKELGPMADYPVNYKPPLPGRKRTTPATQPAGK